MNSIPNLKIENLLTKLEAIDGEIVSAAVGVDDDQIRSTIDARRQILSMLQREIEVNAGNAKEALGDIYQANEHLDEFISLWTSRVKSIPIAADAFEADDICDLVIDAHLPPIWDFKTDIITLVHPSCAQIITALVKRGQRHIVFFKYKTTMPNIDLPTFNLTGKEYDFCKEVDTLDDFQSVIAQIQGRVSHAVTLNCRPADVVSKVFVKDVETALKAGRRTAQGNAFTAARFGSEWAINSLNNIKYMNEFPNLHDLNVKNVQDAVIVASGPSLDRNVAQLAPIQDNVFIVSALRSLPVLEKHGITADLVIQLDAEDETAAHNFANSYHGEIKNLLLEATVNPAFFEINAANKIWSLSHFFPTTLKRMGAEPTPFALPAVSLYAASLCHYLKFENICFIGQDLAADNGKIYPAGSADLPNHHDIDKFDMNVPGFAGGIVKTKGNYQYLIERSTLMAREWKAENATINLVNATEGGAYIEGFAHMKLQDYIILRDLNSPANKKQISFADRPDTRNIDTQSYARDLVNSMQQIIAIAEKIVKLDESIASARGVRKKRDALIAKFKQLNDANDFLQMAMQEEISAVSGTSLEASSIPDYAAFFAMVRNKAGIIKSAAVALK